MKTKKIPHEKEVRVAREETILLAVSENGQDLQFKTKPVRIGEYFGEQPLSSAVPYGVPTFSTCIKETNRTNTKESSERFSAVACDIYGVSPQQYEEQKALLEECLFLAHTLHTHSEGNEGCHRFIVPFARPVPSKEYRLVCEYLERTVFINLGSKLEMNLGDPLNVPICPSEKQHLATIDYNDGGYIDVDRILGDALKTPNRQPKLPEKQNSQKRPSDKRISKKPVLIPMTDIKSEETEWLCYPYIPLGKLIFLQGDPGVGKTWVALSIAAAVSKGWGWPNE